MSEIYYGKLYLSNDDIRRLHGLSEDSIIITQPTEDGIEFLVGSTELKPFMAEGEKSFQNIRRERLLNIVGESVKKPEKSINMISQSDLEKIAQLIERVQKIKTYNYR